MARNSPRTIRKPTRSARPHATDAATNVPARRRLEDAIVGAPLARVFDVHTRLNDGIPTTSTHLAAKWGVSTRTAKRCVELMRDSLEMPIAWNAVTKTYYYTRSFPTLPFLILTRAEALVIALAARVLAPSWGPSFARRFKSLLEKISPVLGSAVSRALNAVEHVHVPPAATTAFDEFELLLPILDAIESRRVVRLDYAKRDAPTSEPRIVHPLDLSHFENVLRLIAYDPARGDVRDFLLTRIRQLQPLDEIFERPTDFDAKKRVENCAGSHAGGEEQEIRIALDPIAAAYARERVWHHSQKLVPLPDGRTEITLRLGDLPGIKHHVLRWGRLAEVLAPAELRADVAEELQAAAVRYGKVVSTG